LNHTNNYQKDQTQFILLDLRDPDDFLLFHIKEAINFPAPWLSRDKMLPALLRFVKERHLNYH
jgi:centrosomal protein CEP41